MAAPAESVSQAIATLENSVPELEDALNRVLDELRRQPKDVAEKRDVDKRMSGIAEAFTRLLDSLVAVRGLAAKADAEREALLFRNASLAKRIQELEADINEWQREYEPDSDPGRPGMFSNIRQALHAFAHRGGTR